MSLKVDKVQLEIIVKSDTTRAEMRKLDDEAKAIQKSMKGLKKDSKEWIEANNKLSKVKADYDALSKSIDLNAKTMKELRSESNRLRAQLNNAVPGTKEWIQYDKELKQVNTRMGELRGTSQKTQSFFSSAANGFNKYFAIFTAALASITGLTLGLKKFMDMRMELEDSQANLQSLTGLGQEDIDWLTQYAQNLSTTTTEAGIKITASSKEIIDGFTVIGSKRPELLKNKEALAEVTKEALTLAATGVPVEEAFNVVTASLNQFNLEGKDSSRVINAIAAGSLAGSAEANNLGDSLKNVGTVANDSNMSLEDTVAMLEVLASKQLLGEEAGTKMRGALLKLKDAGVGYASGQFNVRDALIEVNKQIDAHSKAAEKDAIKIKMFGAENVTAGTILLQNIDAYDKMRIAVTGTNTAYDQAAIRTKTVSANLAQAKNRFNELGMELVQNLNPAMLSATNITNKVIKLLVVLANNWDTVSKILLMLTGYTIAYNAKLLVNNLLLKEGIGLKVKDLALKIKDAVVLEGLILREAIQAATVGKVTLATKAAAAAQAIWNYAMVTNPAGAFIAILTTVVGLIWLLGNRTKEATQLQQSQINIQKKVSEQYDEQASKVDILVAKIHNENLSNAERKKAIEDLKAIIPEYNGMLDKEGKLINDNKTAIDNYLVSLEKQIKMKAAQEEWEALIRKKRLQQKELDKTQAEKEKLLKQSTNTNDPGVKYGGAVSMSDTKKALENDPEGWYKPYANAKKAINETTDAIKNLEQEIKTSNTVNISNGPKEGDTKQIGKDWYTYKGGKWVKDGGGGGSAPTGDKSKTDPAVEERKRYQEEIQKIDEDFKSTLLKNLEKYRDGEFKTEEEYNQAAIDAETKYLNDKLTKQTEFGEKAKYINDEINSDITATNTDIAKQTIDAKKRADDAILKSIKDYQESGNKLIVSGEQTTNNEIEELYAKGIDDQKKHDAKKIELDIKTAKARLGLAQALYSTLEKAEFFDTEKKKQALAELQAQIDAANQAITNATNAQNAAKKPDADNRSAEEKAADVLSDKQKQMQKIFGQSFAEISDMFSQIAALQENLTKGNLENWGDWAAAIGGVIQAGLAVAQKASDDYFQYQANAIEADKQKELTTNEEKHRNKLIGDEAYEKQKKSINDNYAQKELDLKKKQAGADANIKIAQTLAAGAGAIIQALFQLGPIAGAIAGVIIAGTTAFQIGSIIKQRDAIMNTTLDSSSSGGSDTPTSSGARVVTQYADGKYDVIGASDGRTYRNVPYRGNARTGIYSGPVLVSEQGDEMVISNPDLRRMRMDAPAIYSGLSRFVTRQYASGKYDAVNNTSGSLSSIDYSAVTIQLENNTEVMMRVAELLAWLKENKIEAYTLLSEFEKKRDLRDKSLKKGSL